MVRIKLQEVYRSECLDHANSSHSIDCHQIPVLILCLAIGIFLSIFDTLGTVASRVAAYLKSINNRIICSMLLAISAAYCTVKTHCHIQGVLVATPKHKITVQLEVITNEINVINTSQR